jgi:hypothetical protein
VEMLCRDSLCCSPKKVYITFGCFLNVRTVGMNLRAMLQAD